MNTNELIAMASKYKNFNDFCSGLCRIKEGVNYVSH